jgi:hypothetical protein
MAHFYRAVFRICLVHALRHFGGEFVLCLAFPPALQITIHYVTYLTDCFTGVLLRIRGHPAASLVEAMCYKPEGRGFKSR